MKSKKCGKCQQVKAISGFYQHRRDGYQSICKECKREINRLYNHKPERVIYNRQKYKEWVEAGKLKEYNQQPMVKIRTYIGSKARRLKRMGKIKIKSCRVCGNSNAQMHHPDYGKPELIDWLCPIHHAEEHRKIKAEVK